MSSFPNNAYRYDQMDPNLRVTNDNLLSLVYDDDKVRDEMAQARQRKLNEIGSSDRASLAYFKSTINTEDQYIRDFENRLNNYMESKTANSFYSDDFSLATAEENEKQIKFLSNWMGKELHPKPEIIRDWEAYQAIMLEGNLNTSLLTIALTGEAPSQVDPNKIASGLGTYNQTTFMRGSLVGKAQDPTASMPQIGEMITSNAQTIQSLALRWRGGKNGEFWTSTTNNSPYLKEMFTEDPAVKAFLDRAVNMDPYLWDLTALTDSPWFGKSLFDILAEAKAPEGPNKWDAKKAIEEIKTNAPDLAFVLFQQIGLTEDALLQKDIAKNPQTFKYFIADAIDTHAMAIINEKFKQQSNWFTRNTFDLAYPILRDSFNSGDTVAEIGLTFGGAIVGTVGAALVPVGGIGAPIAVGGYATAGAAATSLLLKASRGIKASARIAKAVKLQSTAKNLRRLGRATQALSTVNNKGLKVFTGITKTVSHISKFAPHNLAESVLGLSKGTRLGVLLYRAEELSYKQLYSAGFKEVSKTFGRYLLRSALNGAGQGAIEDAQRQWMASSAGFQSSFEWNTLSSNMLEEGIGEIVLGGTLNAISNFTDVARVTTQKRLEWMDHLKLGLDKKFEKLGTATKDKAIKLWNKLPSDVREKLEIAISTQFGIDSEALQKMSFSDRIDFKVTAIQLNHKLDELGEITGFGNLLIGKSSSSFLEDTLLSVTNGNKDAISADMRMGLTQVFLGVNEATKDQATGDPQLTKDDFKIVAYKWARENIDASAMSDEEKKTALNRLQDTLFKDQFSQVFPNGVDVDIGGTITKVTKFEDIPASETKTLEELAKKLAKEEERISSIIWGADPTATLSSLTQGFVLNTEETALLDAAAEEYARINNLPRVKVKGGGVGTGRVVSSTPSPTPTTPLPATPPAAPPATPTAPPATPTAPPATPAAPPATPAAPPATPTAPPVVPPVSTPVAPPVVPPVATATPPVVPSAPPITPPVVPPATPVTPTMAPSAAPVVEATPEVTEVITAAPEVTTSTKSDVDARIDLGVQRAISSGLEADISPDAEIDDSLIDFIENETSCNLKKD